MEKNCSTCACYWLNVEAEVRDKMDEAQIECSLEEKPKNGKCKYWQPDTN